MDRHEDRRRDHATPLDPVIRFSALSAAEFPPENGRKRRGNGVVRDRPAAKIDCHAIMTRRAIIAMGNYRNAILWRNNLRDGVDWKAD